jgi:hypothetical protein
MSHLEAQALEAAREHLGAERRLLQRSRAWRAQAGDGAGGPHWCEGTRERQGARGLQELSTSHRNWLGA